MRVSRGEFRCALKVAPMLMLSLTSQREFQLAREQRE